MTLVPWKQGKQLLWDVTTFDEIFVNVFLKMCLQLVRKFAADSTVNLSGGALDG